MEVCLKNVASIASKVGGRKVATFRKTHLPDVVMTPGPKSARIIDCLSFSYIWCGEYLAISHNALFGLGTIIIFVAIRLKCFSY